MLSMSKGNDKELTMKAEEKLMCPQCNHNLRKIPVRVQDAHTQAISYQCGHCGYFEFEDASINTVLNELRENESPLKIKQKVVKLSQDRLGMYFNNNVVRSLNLKPGEEIYVSVPDKKHIIIEMRP